MNISIFRNTLILILLLCISNTVDARKKHPATGSMEPPKPKTGIDFIENKGQWVSEARFKADIPGGAMFITANGFVYNFVSQTDLNRIHDLTHHQDKDISNEVVNLHAYKVKIEGANPNSNFSTEDKRKYYNNYFIGNDQSKWAGNVGLFGSVHQQNVYQGIDLSVYSKNNNLKYDFIVNPGASPNQIVLSFEGVVPEVTKEGNLKIKTTVNEIIEQAPYSYQVINGKEVEVPSRYKYLNGKLTFEFPSGYDNTKPLVVDPTLIFATYSGATGVSNFSVSTTYDAAGNLYACAYTNAAGWPVTLNAYQSNAAGLQDAAINKYNTLGNALVYSTFFGGSGNDYGHTMMVNDLEELVVAGSTTSSNLPTTTGCYDNTLGGNVDIFVTHFNATGTALIGSTYVGGSGTDPLVVSATGTASQAYTTQNLTSPVEINIDENGNIWVVSSTQSTDFPLSTNAFQSTFGGTTDGVVFKLNPTCSQLLYSSFVGGTGVDLALGINFNSSGNVVICGSTQSSDLTTTTGVIHPTAPGGNSDGFASIINATTGALLHSTYLGTTDNDQAVNLQVDEYDNVYILGRTKGNYPISTGVYSMPDADVFIDKLSPTLSSSLLSTRLGYPQSNGTGYFPTAFLYDICGNIYVAGLSNTVLPGLPLTNDAFSTVPDNFWFCVLEPHFENLLFASYYGSTLNDHTHVGVNRLDPEGIFYHSVCANSDDFPTTSTSYAPDKLNVVGQDIVSFKFDFEATGVKSDFELDPAVNGNDTGCVPFTVTMLNNSTSAEDFTWDFGDNSPTSNLANPTHVYTVPGVYTITLYANNDSSCITADTAYMTVVVLQTNLPNIIVNDTTLCHFEQQIEIGVEITNPSPNNTINWGPATGLLSAPNLPIVSVDPSANNVYWVTVKDTIPGICGFSITDTVHIDLSPRELSILTNDTVVCEGAVIPIVAIGTPGYSYRWSPSIGVSDTTVLQPNITINQPNIYTLTGSYQHCLDTTVSITIGMHYQPSLELGANKSVCQGTEVALESAVSPFRNDYIYQWTPANGLSTPNAPTADFIADTTGTYHLHVQTPIGCSATDSITVLVYPGGFGGIIADTGYCPPNQAQLWASGGVSYSWSPSYGLSDTTSATPVASPHTTTDYTVLITDIHNCVDTERVSVQVYPVAVLSIPDSVTVYPGEQYHVQPESNCLYFQWFPPSGLSNANIADPLMSPSVRTRYFVTGTTEHGCSISDSMDVLVSETVIDMPNAFTPGSNNKVFKPAKRGIAQLKSFTVFNRWGNNVFTTTNIDEGWDGSFNGQPQPLGVYMYIIEAVADNGKVFTKQGNVTLIR